MITPLCLFCGEMIVDEAIRYTLRAGLDRPARRL
jgi:hypothetical protein